MIDDVKAIGVVEIITRPDGGGAELLVRELTTRLPSYGIDIYTVYLNNPLNVPLGPNEESLDVIRYQGPSTLFRLMKRLRQLRKEKETPLIHAHLTWPLYHTAFAAIFLRFTLIYTEHSTHNRRRNWSFLRPLERWVYAKYANVICITEGVHRALALWLGTDNLKRRLITVENGARMLPMASRKPINGRALRLISIGSLHRRKGFDVAVQAVALLGDIVEEYVVLGEGPERQNLQAKAASLGLAHKLRMPGFCDDIVPHLHRADLALVPSRWEGFGLVSIEALSTGLPVVGSDVAGLSDVLEHCAAALLCEPDDHSALADGIKAARNGLVGIPGIATAARRHAERFDIEIMVRNYAQLYRKISGTPSE